LDMGRLLRVPGVEQGYSRRGPGSNPVHPVRHFLAPARPTQGSLGEALLMARNKFAGKGAF